MTKCSECGKSFKKVAIHKARAHGKLVVRPRPPSLVVPEEPLTLEQAIDNYWLGLDLSRKMEILSIVEVK